MLSGQRNKYKLSNANREIKIGIKISRAEKFQKINNRGGGDDYSAPESRRWEKLYQTKAY